MEDQGVLDGFPDEFMCNNFLTADDMNMDFSFQDLNFDIGDHLNERAHEGNTTHPVHELLLPDPDENLLDDYLHHSDSSDSGIYPSAVKEEPLSPFSISGSDVSEGYGSSPDGHTVKIEPVKTEPLTEMPQTVAGGLPGQVALPLVTQATPTTAATIPLISHHGEDGGTIFINAMPSTPVLGGPPPPQTSIHNILSSKIKIQPKPPQPSTSPPPRATAAVAAASVVPKETHQPTVAPAPRPISSSQPLVVTPQQFQQMTAQGTLCWQQPTLSPAQPEVNCRNAFSELDSKQRRQQRMIKNRESASLSRKRKKEYVQDLENRVKVLTAEVEEMKKENMMLRNKLEECPHHRTGGCGGPAPRGLKRGTVFLFVGLLVSFSLLPWASVLTPDWRPPNMALEAGGLHRGGRHLLSLPEDSQNVRASGAKGGRDPYGLSSSGTEFPQRLQQLKEEIQDGLLSGMFNDTSFAGLSMCPSHFNSTESMRLAEQLAGWMVLQEEEQRRKLVKRRRQQRRKADHPVRALKTALHGSFQLYNRGGDLGGREPSFHMQVYQGQPDQRQEFLKAIHRRNDTFYVLSFNTDYFLVPALAHNKTMRPRMSLVMPALGLNETMQPPPGQVGMMQIDCEVFNTQLIHVEKSAVPPSFVNSSFDSQRPPHDSL